MNTLNELGRMGDGGMRGEYFGAMCYLINKIWAVNPRIRIVIGNYFSQDYGAAADAQAAAIAQAKVDAAEALKGYYTKTEVDNLLSTNSTGDRAYAKQYTDELFGSFKFAANSDIDALFA